VEGRADQARLGRMVAGWLGRRQRGAPT
jgi:hypothetical protein